MSTQERIGKLQDLLERVQMRAAAPRGNGAAHVQAFPPASPAPPEVAPAATPAPAYAQAAAAAAYRTPEPVPVEPDSNPTMTSAEVVGDYGGEAELGMDAEVEISSETVEVDIDIDEPMEPMEPMALESGAQPIAQSTMPPEELEEETQDIPIPTQPSVHPAAELEEVVEAAPALANEIEEPAPSSSRRPIAAEEAEAEAYAEESAPRHTPPPESGKQVAAAPSAHPPAARKSSAPPPSLEGHTLIGGWREPGLGVPQVSPGASAASGVRVPAAPGGPVPAAASGTRLSPDVTRPELAAGGAGVATFTGAAPVAKPTTLGDLLDMTLAL